MVDFFVAKTRNVCTVYGIDQNTAGGGVVDRNIAQRLSLVFYKPAISMWIGFSLHYRDTLFLEDFSLSDMTSKFLKCVDEMESAALVSCYTCRDEGSTTNRRVNDYV